MHESKTKDEVGVLAHFVFSVAQHYLLSLLYFSSENMQEN